MTDECIGGAEQIIGQARGGNEAAHQDEERNDRKLFIHHRGETHLSDHGERRRKALQQRESGKADE